MPPTVFILGPSLDNVIEPGTHTIGVVQVAGRRGVGFQSPPTRPGGVVLLKLSPPMNPGDVRPLNVYSFFVQPAESVPAAADRTPDWFFKSGAPSGFTPVAADTVDFEVTVAGVKPSLQPYFVQTVLEFQVS